MFMIAIIASCHLHHFFKKKKKKDKPFPMYIKPITIIMIRAPSLLVVITT
jgi:hypothetical protein